MVGFHVHPYRSWDHDALAPRVRCLAAQDLSQAQLHYDRDHRASVSPGVSGCAQQDGNDRNVEAQPAPAYKITRIPLYGDGGVDGTDCEVTAIGGRSSVLTKPRRQPMRARHVARQRALGCVDSPLGTHGWLRGLTLQESCIYSTTRITLAVEGSAKQRDVILQVPVRTGETRCL